MKKYLLITALLLSLSSCAGRIPSTDTAQDIITGYFNKYGKKYQETAFGNHKVQQVQIISMEEIQKNLAYGTALLTLDNGSAFKINMNFIYKAPLGWRQQGWELVSEKTSSPPPNIKP